MEFRELGTTGLHVSANACALIGGSRKQLCNRFQRYERPNFAQGSGAYLTLPAT